MTITFHAVNIIIDIMMVMVAFCYSPQVSPFTLSFAQPLFLIFHTLSDRQVAITCVVWSLYVLIDR